MTEIKNEAEWIEDSQEKLPDETGDYEVEMWLSTDGKHTVKINAKNPKARREAVKKGMELYDYILERYGTKQAQSVKEYSKTPQQTQEAIKEEQKDCPHTVTSFLQVKKEGANQRRWFKQCKTCKKFLGFTS